MFPDEARNRQDMLKSIILELSERLIDNDDMIEQYLNRLCKIYEDGFRHRYSDFFPIILTIRKNDNSYDNDYLMNNLESMDYYLEKLQNSGDKRYDKYQDMYLPFVKLIDHLNLQISQLTYSSLGLSEKRLQQLVMQLQVSDAAVQRANKALDKVNKGVKKANQQANKVQSQMATILGIFAAIVIAFSGGLTVLGNSISAIGQAQYPESIVLALIICGIVIFDTLSYLMYMISRIIDRNILIGCKAKSCAECNENYSCKWGTRVRKRFPYLFYFNLFAVLGIIVDMIVWFLDIRGFVG